MKIYLDNCSLQRPLDDQTHERIELESKEIIRMLSLCESGSLTLVSSEVLQIEINRISDLERREASLEILRIAGETIAVTSEIKERARELGQYGLKTFDALHLASAEAAKADYFCTADDKFLKKAKTAQDNLRIKVVSPLELMEEILK